MSDSGLKLPAQSESEARADRAAHHEHQADVWDMMAGNMPPDDPGIPGCRAEADKERAIARGCRG